MKIIDNDVMKSDVRIAMYLAEGEVIDEMKRKYPGTYRWLLPRRPLATGTIFIAIARFDPYQEHVIFYAEEENGGIKAGTLHQMLKDAKEYIKGKFDGNEIGISRELYQIIMENDFIKE